MYNWVLSALVVAVVIHSIDCVCDSSPDCQSLRFREGLSTGAPCCQCRNVRGFRCRRGERFVPIQGLGRCCSDPSRVIRWNEGFIPTSRVSESNTVYFTPRIEREFLVPRRDVQTAVSLPKLRRSQNVPLTVIDEPNYTGRIIRGRPDIPRQATYQAAILRLGRSGILGPLGPVSERHVCGGSIIAHNVIITAAHCFLGSRFPGDYIIRVGDFNRLVPESAEQRIRPRQILSHRSFAGGRGAFDYDVALIILEQSIRFIPNVVEAIRLPPPGVPVTGLNNCFISGWGRTNPVAGPPSDLLQIADTIVPNAMGQRVCMQRSEGRMTSRMLCAGYIDDPSRTDACIGDSGGPLACRTSGGTYLVGIVSWGPDPCANPRFPGQYANVQAFYGQIQQVLRQVTARV